MKANLLNLLLIFKLTKIEIGDIINNRIVLPKNQRSGYILDVDNPIIIPSSGNGGHVIYKF
jgi:hypothetical protein